MTARRRLPRAARYVVVMPDEPNVVEYAQSLADAMSADLEEPVHALDVLDWLASVGLTLRRDEGDAAAAYGLLVGEAGADEDDRNTSDG